MSRMLDEKTYKRQRDLRDMIDGELNRIAVTDSEDEIRFMVFHLILNISALSKIHLFRIFSESGDDEENGDDPDRSETLII